MHARTVATLAASAMLLALTGCAEHEREAAQERISSEQSAWLTDFAQAQLRATETGRRGRGG